MQENSSTQAPTIKAIKALYGDVFVVEPTYAEGGIVKQSAIPIVHKEWILPQLIKENVAMSKMNIYEKTGAMEERIFDAERRLGSYLAVDGCEKTDAYAQRQISLINEWSREIAAICREEEAAEDGSN